MRTKFYKRCPACKGKGYLVDHGREVNCLLCGGKGLVLDVEATEENERRQEK